MKAPLTGNSITDRVVYTGLYVPEPAAHAGHGADEEHGDPVAAAEREKDAGGMALEA